MKNTDFKLHLAAQYLATVAKNYIEAQSDDSHTNLGWIAETNSFSTRKLSNGDTLELRACSMVLNWNGMSAGTFNLNGSRHQDVLEWLNAMAKSNGLENYVFDLHYSIDSGEFNDDLSFSMVDSDRCDILAKWRNNAYKSCENVLVNLGLEGEVRTWPHHFDTGSYIPVAGTEIGIGFGMAIPDINSKDYYLYTSAYQGHDGMSTKGLAPLTKGSWKEGDWKGAMLSVEGLALSDYETFFFEAISIFLKQSKLNAEAS